MAVAALSGISCLFAREADGGDNATSGSGKSGTTASRKSARKSAAKKSSRKSSTEKSHRTPSTAVAGPGPDSPTNSDGSFRGTPGVDIQGRDPLSPAEIRNPVANAKPEANISRATQDSAPSTSGDLGNADMRAVAPAQKDHENAKAVHESRKYAAGHGPHAPAPKAGNKGSRRANKKASAKSKKSARNARNQSASA